MNSSEQEISRSPLYRLERVSQTLVGYTNTPHIMEYSKPSSPLQFASVYSACDAGPVGRAHLIKKNGYEAGQVILDLGINHVIPLFIQCPIQFEFLSYNYPMYTSHKPHKSKWAHSVRGHPFWLPFYPGPITRIGSGKADSPNPRAWAYKKKLPPTLKIRSFPLKKSRNDNFLRQTYQRPKSGSIKQCLFY